MAKVANPRKNFQFNIIIPGMNPFLCQKARTPDIELDQVEHGDTNFDVKTAGRKKVSALTIDKISDAVSPDLSIRTWMEQIQSTRTGGGMLPSAYKKDIVIEQLAPDGISVVERFVATGAWPMKRNGSEFDRKGSENTTETIEFSVDDLYYN